MSLGAQGNITGANTGSTVGANLVTADGLTQQDLLADAMNMFDNLGISVNESIINFTGGLDFSPTVVANVDPNSCEISIRESILTNSGTQQGAASRCMGDKQVLLIAVFRWNLLSQERKVTSQIQNKRLMESLTSSGLTLFRQNRHILTSPSAHDFG